MNKTFDYMRTRLYRKNLIHDIFSWVGLSEGCHTMQRDVFEVHNDFTRPLTSFTNGNKYVIGLSEAFNKWVDAKAVTSTTEEEAERFILDKMLCRLRIASHIHTHQTHSLIQ
ncbi:hypothetical protein RF11_08203 [Thelohanellus kitauei]|uniref:Integrase catalytic domain-containing protein n=1 Tax=Thelohanellus kitauei TaxID=669202 RepID=A0A0C2NIH1_THEKT|nr:hypothetical protein RF11_08203 [Thelohanellus kitauei]